MKKTKHFNISVPELGDVPDITQVSNAISDLEDATAGTLEIMKAEMQGTKITLTSVSRKTKRTGYYEGMSIRFKSPQDIEPNYLKTISVDDLGDQTLSVEYKVNRNEYIDIVYEGNKFTAYPIVVQKTDSVSENSSILVGTAKGVKTAYDKGVEALNKANQAQSSANVAQSTADGKVSKKGDTMTGPLRIDADGNNLKLLSHGVSKGELIAIEDSIALYNTATQTMLRMYDNGNISIPAKNLTTASKEIVGSINELNSGKENKIDRKSGFNLDKSDSVASNSSNTIATSLAVKTAYDKAGQAQSTADGKVSKNGDTMTGSLRIINALAPFVADYTSSLSGGFARGYGVRINGVTKSEFGLYGSDGQVIYTYLGSDYTNPALKLYHDGTLYLRAKNLKTNHKEVVDAINELNSKCPYNIGDIYITTNSGNPSTTWLGTTWQKIEGRMLLGTSGSGASKATGGSNTVTLSTANLPSHTHSASQSAHTHSQPAHTHSMQTGGGFNDDTPIYNNGNVYLNWSTTLNTNPSGGDTTGSATPSISIGATGGSAAFSILSAYYTVHIWLRTA